MGNKKPSLTKTATGAGRVASKLGNQRDQEKVWQNFQLPRGLRESVVRKAKSRRDNLSKFYRQCAEIYLNSVDAADALKRVKSLVTDK